MFSRSFRKSWEIYDFVKKNKQILDWNPIFNNLPTNISILADLFGRSASLQKYLTSRKKKIFKILAAKKIIYEKIVKPLLKQFTLLIDFSACSNENLLIPLSSRSPIRLRATLQLLKGLLA